jgi:uncharacterized membrane protein
MESEGKGGLRSARVLIIALVVVIIVPGLALILAAISRSVLQQAKNHNVLVNSTDACTCHSRTTPGIVEQYGPAHGSRQYHMHQLP